MYYIVKKYYRGWLVDIIDLYYIVFYKKGDAYVNRCDNKDDFIYSSYYDKNEGFQYAFMPFITREDKEKYFMNMINYYGFGEIHGLKSTFFSSAEDNPEVYSIQKYHDCDGTFDNPYICHYKNGKQISKKEFKYLMDNYYFDNIIPE